MEDFIKETLNILENYFIYIYPGFISLYIFRFANGKSFNEDKISILKSIVMSYVYIIILSTFFKFDFQDISNKNHVVLLLISIIVPILVHAAGDWEWLRRLLSFLSIDTSMRENTLDTLRSLGNDETISVKLFLDDKGLMYEGKLRLHESDKNKEKIIGVSHYRRYIKQEERFVIKQNYENDGSRWVILQEKDITRIEVKFETKK